MKTTIEKIKEVEIFLFEKLGKRLEKGNESMSDFGASFYYTLDRGLYDTLSGGLTVRISGHSTGLARAKNEIHFSNNIDSAKKLFDIYFK